MLQIEEDRASNPVFAGRCARCHRRMAVRYYCPEGRKAEDGEFLCEKHWTEAIVKRDNAIRASQSQGEKWEAICG